MEIMFTPEATKSCSIFEWQTHLNNEIIESSNKNEKQNRKRINFSEEKPLLLRQHNMIDECRLEEWYVDESEYELI